MLFYFIYKFQKNFTLITYILTYRASAEEMRQAAAANSNLPPPANRQNSMQSNLVANAQPISFTGSPVYDSNV